MAALITTDFTLPEEYVAGVFKKAQTSSVLAQLSGSQPQKFGKSNVMVLTGAPKAELVAEGGQKSPTPTTYASKAVTPAKLQVTVRVSNEVMWADEDYQMGVMADIQENCGIALGRALDIVGIHKANPLTGTAASSVTEGLVDATDKAELSGSKYDEAVEAAAGLVIANGYVPTGIAIDPAFSFGLATMRDTTGRRIYPELGYGTSVTNFEGMDAAVSDTVSGKELSKASDVLGIVGQFDAFRWGVQREIAAHVIEYGDPDGPGRPPAPQPGGHPRRGRLRHRHHGPQGLRQGHQGRASSHGPVRVRALRLRGGERQRAAPAPLRAVGASASGARAKAPAEGRQGPARRAPAKKSAARGELTMAEERQGAYATVAELSASWREFSERELPYVKATLRDASDFLDANSPRAGATPPACRPGCCRSSAARS